MTRLSTEQRRVKLIAEECRLMRAVKLEENRLRKLHMADLKHYYNCKMFEKSQRGGVVRRQRLDAKSNRLQKRVNMRKKAGAKLALRQQRLKNRVLKSTQPAVIRQGYVINPTTERQIKIDGAIYKKLVKSGVIKSPTTHPRKIASMIKDVMERGFNLKSPTTHPSKIPRKIASTIKDAMKKGFNLKPKLPKPHPIAVLITQHNKKGIILLDKALKGAIRSYGVNIVDDTPIEQLNITADVVRDTIISEVREKRGVKPQITLKIEFEKFEGAVTITQDAFFNSKALPIMSDNKDKISEFIDTQSEHIMNNIDKWLGNGSGWVVNKVLKHILNIYPYKPLRGSSYMELPPELRHHRKGLINIKNKNDNECFRWCHLAHKFPAKRDRQRLGTYKLHIDSLDYNDVEFPVSIKHIGKIERQNEISINIFGYEDGQRYPIYISDKKNCEDTMDLLLLTSIDGENVNSHYCLITDFNRFMFNQNKHKEKKHFCRYCLQCFSSEEILTNHKSNCLTVNGKQAVKMPDPEKAFVKFRNYQRQLNAPFIIYADFECITKKLPEHVNTNQKSYTHAYQKHTPCGFGYKVVCCYNDTYSKSIVVHRGEDAAFEFLKVMVAERDYCSRMNRKHFNKPLQMSGEDEGAFQNAINCHICGEKLGELDDEIQKPVRDHCHITGEYRGAAHNVCNRSFRLTNRIPVVFHNLRGYDSHILVQEMGRFVNAPENFETVWKKDKNDEWISEQKQMDLNVIPNNMEKYMAMMMGKNLVFIDSFQFMGSSLDKLVSNLDSFPILKRELERAKLVEMCYGDDLDVDEQLELLSKKGVYPYDYMDVMERFDETELPPKDAFYSLLNDEHITDEDYKRAQVVWKKFKLRDMGEYHDLYLKTDILLLADVFESFRRTCSQHYGLDPAHYFTAPGLAWDSALKMTGVRLDLMTDVDMYQFIEKGMRGGVSYIANRYGEANNKYMDNFNPDAPSKYLMYLDANNLYGWAMSQFLPTGGFEWIENPNNIDLSKYTDEGKNGLILEVDLEYPAGLHDLHNDYPLAPEQVEVQKEMLSDYCLQLREKFNVKVGGVRKLIPTLRKKKNYVLHYRNLQQYLSLGLRLTKIHRALEFNQSPWLGKYINFNTRMRTKAVNAFEKDFFKLMNNSVFGKTMENLRKRVDVRLVSDEQKLLKLTSKPTFVSSKIINEDMVIVHRVKECITLNKPAYVGMCILDLSKTLMYDFHYNYIKVKYGHQAKLLFTDTDSLTYEIGAEDVYADFWRDRHMFDNSGYSPESPFYDSTNKKVIGKMKDELGGVPMREFVGLRSKMYSYICSGTTNLGGKTAKGVKKGVVKKCITHEDYKDTLFKQQQMRHRMRTIRSQKHQLHSYEINKTSLSCFDDKRYILGDGVSSYAYGHHRIILN